MNPKIGDKLKLSARSVKDWARFYPKLKQEILEKRRYEIIEKLPYGWKVKTCFVDLDDFLNPGGHFIMADEQDVFVSCEPGAIRDHNHPLTRIFK